MKILLQKYLTEAIDEIPQNKAYLIWKKTDITGRAYWGVLPFCGLDDHPAHPNQDLSQLEWDGNEVYLDAQTEEAVPDMLRKAIGILAFWKNELETKYPDTPFYLFASYDNGDMQILGEAESPVRSVTLRFWADRGGNPAVDLSAFDEWVQPAMMESCNFQCSP